MFEALFDQIKGVIGKNYAFAGLVPSLALILGWKWFQAGNDELVKLLDKLLQEPSQLTAEAVVFCLSVAGLALIFFVTRRSILRLFQELPGFVLTPLRRKLIGLQSQNWRKANRIREECLWQYTAIRWYLHGFSKPGYVPPWARSPAASDAVQASSESRSIVAQLAPSIARESTELTEKDSETILRGLMLLIEYSAVAAESPECVKEVQAWTDLLAKASSKEVLHRVEVEVSRRFAQARKSCQRLPRDPRWIQPTSLGNRVASLDDYAEDRYGLDTGSLWNRLWGVLSQEERQGVTDGQLGVEAFANLSMALGILSVSIVWEAIRRIATGIQSRDYSTSWRAVILSLIAMWLALMSYRAAVSAFDALSERVIRLIDLRRLHLIRALGFKTPATVSEEKAIFAELRGFFSQAIPLNGNRQLEQTPSAG